MKSAKNIGIHIQNLIYNVSSDPMSDMSRSKVETFSQIVRNVVKSMFCNHQLNMASFISVVL